MRAFVLLQVCDQRLFHIAKKAIREEQVLALEETDNSKSTGDVLSPSARGYRITTVRILLGS